MEIFSKIERITPAYCLFYPVVGTDTMTIGVRSFTEIHTRPTIICILYMKYIGCNVEYKVSILCPIERYLYILIVYNIVWHTVCVQQFELNKGMVSYPLISHKYYH
jgi:hypothetical protein